MPSRPMTQSSYVRARGAKCPYCRGDQLEGSEITVNGGIANQEMTCLGCQATWYDDYNLVGYTEITPPVGPSEDDEKDEPNQ